MKKKFLLVLGLLSMLMFTGCKDSDRKLGTLSAPQQVTVQSDNGKSLIIFDEVENAEYYNIYINNTAITVKASGTGTIQFDASKIITLPQNYTIKIKAGAEKYFDSAFSGEYEYSYTSMLATPTITIDGTILNWDRVVNADFYDITVSTTNPAMETIHRVATNKFDFKNILGNRGVYSFKVQAISLNSEYENSEYSNKVNYTNYISLITPYQLKTSYDLSNNELLLTYVSSENVESFVIKVEDKEYILSGSNLSSYLKPTGLTNVYTLKLSSFLDSYNISLNNSKTLNISVKADNYNQAFINDSGFSETIACEIVTKLGTPTISIAPVGENCELTITNKFDKTYLSGYEIYLNDEKYKSIASDISIIQIPNDKLVGKGIRVRATSNNNNCYSSNLSDVKYYDTTSTLGNINFSITEDVLSWNSVENAEKYYIEISNSIFMYSTFTDETSITLDNICQPDVYNIKVVAMANGYKQTECAKQNVNYIRSLDKVSNVSVQKLADSIYLNFEEVDDAYGYVVYLNDSMIEKVFTQSHINITSYVASASSYNINVQAIKMSTQDANNGSKSDTLAWANVQTLSAPKLSITESGGKYYLNIDVNEKESALAGGYQLWINYVSVVDNATFQDHQEDITSYFANAGEYNFMVQAKASQTNANVKDSTISTIKHKVTKQLDVVTDISVQLTNEGKYILTFTEQTSAAKYLVTITKANDEQYNEVIEIESGYADISDKVKANGTYNINVKALALKDGFYTDSTSSGNPYRLSKGETLSTVKNINITKETTSANGEIYVTWDSVENATGYQAYVYYKDIIQNRDVLKQSIYVVQNSTPKINIGSGTYKCVGKEGQYRVQVKAIGDGYIYESSQPESATYQYTMDKVADFKRYSVPMYGNYYSYYVTTFDQLQHLLWYHYLYNDDTKIYNSSTQYNLKIYSTLSFNSLPATIADKVLSGETETVQSLVDGAANNTEKLSIVARALLNQYPEIAVYLLGVANEQNELLQPFCTQAVGEGNQNIYMFAYQNKLNNDKLSRIDPDKVAFGEVLAAVDSFDQRADNYAFAIDVCDSLDVTTTEQLYIALQYNKKPNFVGDSAVAKAVYDNARFVLRNICTDNMTEYEKVLQIYDFLAKRITYNANVSLGGASGLVNGVMRGNLADFYLEGVLYNFGSKDGLFTDLDQFVGQTAVCDGLSKAFVVLCSIEGIDSIKIKSTTHAWNKVYIDIDTNDEDDTKKWYVIDITGAIQYNSITTPSKDKYQVSMHDYFLIKDGSSSNVVYFHQRLGNSTNYVAETSAVNNYYQRTIYNYTYSYIDSNKGPQTISYNGNLIVGEEGEEDLAITLQKLVLYGRLKTEGKYRVVLELDRTQWASGNETITNAITGAGGANSVVTNVLGGQYSCNIFTMYKGNYMIIAFNPN